MFSSGRNFLTNPAPTPSSGSPQPTGPTGTFTLMFEDTFTGTSLNTTKWSPYWFSEGAFMSGAGVNTASANNVVGGGSLTMTLSSHTVGACVNTDPSQVSPGYSFTTGVVEAKIYFPGNGTNACYNWGGFWTTGQNWPTTGENDIAECLGGVPQTHHIDSSGNPGGGSSSFYLGNAFHIYTLQRFSDHVVFWYDGVQIASIATHETVSTSPHYIVLDVGTGQSSPEVTGSAGAMIVDYVRGWV